MAKDLFEGDLPLIREALRREIEVAWKRLSGAGTWWTGAERLAIVAEARRATNCALCQERKDALSPAMVAGEHEASGMLSAPTVEAIHRLVTDAGRITEKWVRGVIDEDPEGGLPETHYVEVVGIVATLTALDSFQLALGLPLRELPSAQPGEPKRERPAKAKRDIAWVSTLDPDDLDASDLNPFVLHGNKNIHRGVSLVPQEVINFFDLDVELYLKDHEIRDFRQEFRAISHAQIELIAGRTSALNGCYY